jgi:hypothetical protein
MITDLISSSQERSAAMSMNGAFFGVLQNIREQ